MRRCILLLVLLGSATPAPAQTDWTGNTSTNWNTASNWSNGIPTGGNIFFATNASRTTLDLGGGTSAALNNVVFQNPTLPGFTLQNGTLLMANGGDVRINFDAASVTQNITMGIVFQGSGLLTNNAGGAVLSVGNVSTNAAGAQTLTVNATGQIRINGIISNGTGGGTLGLVKTGIGKLTLLSASSSYTGTTTINAGVLSVNNVANAGSPSGIGAGSGIVFGGGTLEYTHFQDGATDRSITLNSGGGTVGVTVGFQSLSLNGAVSGAGGLTKQGGGTVRLNNATNSYLGVTTINEGTISVGMLADGGAQSPIGTASSIVFNGGTLAYDNSSAAGRTNRAFVINAGGGTINVAHNVFMGPTGPLTGSGRLTKIGSGLLDMTFDNSGFTGPVTLNGGLVTFSPSRPDWSNSAITLSGSPTVQLRPATSGEVIYTMGSITGTGSIVQADTSRAVTLIVGANGTDTDFDGIFRQMDFGPLSLIKVGTGTFFPHGDSNYGGSTTINGGTIVVQSLSNFGSSSTIGSGSNITFGGGTLRFDNTTNTGTNRDLTLNAGGGTIEVTRANGALTLSGSSVGTGGLTKTGPGTLTLTGTNSYSGGTTISDGTLQIGNGSTTGSITGDVINHGVLAFNRTTDLNYGGKISGTGSLAKSGTGILTLGEVTNTYSSGTFIYRGVINTAFLNASGTISPIGTGGVTFDGGSLRYTNAGFDATTNRSVTFSAGGGTIDVNSASRNVTWTSNFTGIGGLTKAGPGTLTLTGTNGYTGNTLITAGTLQIGNGGTTGSIIGNVVNNGELFFNRSNNLTFGGMISGIGSVTKTGGGTLTLTGSNSYTGETTVTQGILAVNNTSGTGTGTGLITLGTGSTLTGTGRLGGSLQVGGGANLSPGNSIGRLNADTGVTIFAPNGKYTVEYNSGVPLVPGTTIDHFNSAGLLAVTATPGAGNTFVIDLKHLGSAGGMASSRTDVVIGTFAGGQTDFNTAKFSFTGDFAGASPTISFVGSNSLSISFTPVPEPATILSLSAAGMGLLGLVRRNNRRSSIE